MSEPCAINSMVGTSCVHHGDKHMALVCTNPGSYAQVCVCAHYVCRTVYLYTLFVRRLRAYLSPSKIPIFPLLNDGYPRHPQALL